MFSRETTWHTVYPKKYAHGYCFAVLCCGYTLTDFPISIRLTSLALWQSNDCPSASKATLMNMDKYFMWMHYQRLHNHNKAKHNKTMCIFLGIYCIWTRMYYTLSCRFVILRRFQTSALLSIVNKVRGYTTRFVDRSICRMFVQYIPRNMHTVLLCFALLWLCNRS